MSDTVLELPPDTTLPPAPPAETTEAPAERQLSAREQAMMSIVENRERARALELAYGQEATTPDPEEAAAAEERATEEARRALETAAPADAPKPAVEPPKPTPAAPQTIVIDGIHFTPEQAAQLARDGLVARKAVQEFQRQQTQPRQTPPPVPQPPPRGPILAEDEAKALARDLVYGDETTNAKAIQRIVETAVSRVAPTPQVDPNAIIRAAVQQTRQAIDLQNNLATVGAEFPEIFGSPDDFTPAHNRRSQLAALALGDLRKRDAAMGVFRSDLDLYREAARTVRDELGLVPPQSQPAPDGTPAPQAAQPSRLERKRAAPSLPQAADRRAVSAPTRQYPTSSEIVEQMRKARGLAPMR